MDEHIRRRLSMAMARHGVEAVVAYSKENVTYCAGYVVPSMALGIRNRQFAVAVNRDGQAGMLLSSNELTEAEARASVRDLRPYDEFTDDPMEILAGLLNELGVSRARVGLELDAIPADRWERLRSLLPQVTWVDGGPVLAEARMVKSPHELEQMRQVTHIAHLAQSEAHAMVHEGMTERELSRAIVDRALAHGADSVLMVQVAAGERSGYSNPTPSDRPMRRGEMVKVDVSLSLGGYLSDTGHGVVIAEASPRQQEIWHKVADTLATVEDAVKPGISTGELWRIFTATFERHGISPSISFLGHGLGLSLHEEPFFAAHTDTPLEPGMTFAIEPVYYDTDGTQYFLEDNLALTESGLENLTTVLPHDLILIH